MENNSLAVYDRMTNPLDAVKMMGEFIAKSGMFGCEKIEQGQVIAMTCLTENISPLKFKQTYHLIDGNPSMRADAMLAKFRGLGGRHKVISRTAEKAEIELTFEKQVEKFSFNWADAQKETFPFAKDGKPKKNWATPYARTQVMWARVCSEGVRTMAPEVVAGIYTPEEMEDRLESAVINMAPIAAEVVSAPASSPTPTEQAKKVQEKPIDVVAEPVSEKKIEPPKSEPVKTHVAKNKTGKETIDAETEGKVLEAIGDSMDDAAAWLIHVAKWMTEPNVGQLPAARAQKILDNPPGFRKRVKGSAAKFKK